MRSLLLALVASSFLGTVACTPKDDNKNNGYAGTHGNPGPVLPNGQGQPPYNPGQSGYPGSGYGQGYGYGQGNGYGQLPAEFDVLNLKVGQTAIKTVRGAPGTSRDDLETVRISCMDTTSQAQNSNYDGIIMVDGSEMSLMGNFSRRKPHTFVTCSDRSRRDDRWARHFQGAGERRLQVGQLTTVQVKTNKNRFRRDQLISLTVSCGQSPNEAFQMGRQGLSLTRGSKIIVNQDLRRNFGGIVQFKIDASSVISCQ